MSKSAFVLRTLKILGLEEVLKLSQLQTSRAMPMKKAAGEELIVWDEEEMPASSPPPARDSRAAATQARVLPFTRKAVTSIRPQVEPAAPPELTEGCEEFPPADTPWLEPSEMVLWQRELAKATGQEVSKLDAFKGYKKITESYMIKSKTLEGKQRVRFAATNGVLINKKQD